MKYIIGFILFPFLSIAQVNYSAYDAMLKQYVNTSGVVNYTGLKKVEAGFKKSVEDFKSKTPGATASKEEQLAYWINVYNAETIKLVLANFPLKSIQNLDGGKPWDVKRIKAGSSIYSLNDIENMIIRPKFNDPRVHFALNCGAKSCPPLLNSAYQAVSLNSTLDKQARNFINSPLNGTITAKSMTISKIFEWYAKDFGNIVTFVNKYSNTKVEAAVKPVFNTYNWSLNGN
jgi:hypothetical protein